VIDPLNLPWGSKNKKTLPETREAATPAYLGLRNEAVRDGLQAPRRIKIQVSGIDGTPSATYEVAYQHGVQLKYYLDQLRLKHLASRAAMRDLSNPGVARLRLNYVPTEKSHITLGNPSVSSVMHLQRSRVDAQDVAANMGRTGSGPAPKVVERKKL
jgi:hypothetical protein